jgi:hypothetical protein
MKDINNEVRSRTFGYISGALGLVAGLAWNEAISNMINVIFPLSKDTIWVKFLYAIIVTGAVVVLVRFIERLTQK